jgi:predicted dehydrogenase
MPTVRWGVLSTSHFSTNKVVPAMQKGEYCLVEAIASRNLDRAQRVAAKLHIPNAYGSYEELLADPEIDAVYIPLPNHLHVPWSIKALQAGKHVLCEKPIALTNAQANELLVEADKHPELKVMEAFMYRHHPQWFRVKEIIANGEIGDLRTLSSFFSYYNVNPEDIRNRVNAGGGGLLDIGCYSISLSRYCFAQDPQRVFGTIENDPQYKVDRLTSGIMEFAQGTAIFTCSTQLAPFQRAHIFGTQGRIEIWAPFTPEPDKPTRILVERNGEIEQLSFEACNQYTIQGDLFSQAILDDQPVPTPLKDAVANMKVIDAIFTSAQSGAWVTL